MTLSARIQAIVADDEPLCRSGLREMLRAFPHVTVVAEATTGAEAVQMVQALAPDLLFLDVQMPELTGLDVVRDLGAGLETAIVFVTAFEEHALSAFDADAVDYLLKPFNESRLARSIERAERFLAGRSASAKPQRHAPQRFVVRDRNRITLVEPHDLDWIESWGNYVRLFVNGSPLLTRETLASIEARLDASEFVRISRRVIVSVERIERLTLRDNGQTDVVLRGGYRLVASRRCRERLQSAIVHG